MKYNSVAYCLDPVRFARECLDFMPDPVQAQVLDPSIHRGILNCTRQWGKSTVCAVIGVHRAIYTPGSLVIVGSPTIRQSGEMVRKMAEFLRMLGVKTRGDGANRTAMNLPNGSRIVGLPGTEGTIRGFSAASLVLIDEAALVRDELYRSIRPMLAVGRKGADGKRRPGDVWLMSTPRGKRGFFYKEWVSPTARWTRISVPATECDRISPEFLEEEREALGDPWFSREYLCQFVQDEDCFFEEGTVRRCLRRDIKPLWG